jgi:hypothetical protein
METIQSTKQLTARRYAMTLNAPHHDVDDASAAPLNTGGADPRAVLERPMELHNGFVIPNRLAKAALSEGLGRRDFSPGSRIKNLYRRWAHSGVGLSITGNVMVDRRAIGEPGNIVVENRRHLNDLAEWATVAKAGGSKIWVQINHPGRQIARHFTRQPVAPSAIALPATAGMFAEPRALSGGEIDDIIRRFATTARILTDAGFDFSVLCEFRARLVAGGTGCEAHLARCVPHRRLVPLNRTALRSVLTCHLPSTRITRPAVGQETHARLQGEIRGRRHRTYGELCV